MKDTNMSISEKLVKRDIKALDDNEEELRRMKDTNVPVEKKCNGHRSPGGSVSYCFGECQSVPVEKWEERIELARRRCSEIIDLDQEPPVKYISMRCKAALEEIEELDELHKKVLSQAIQAAKEEERKMIEEEVEKLGGYSNTGNHYKTRVKGL